MDSLAIKELVKFQRGEITEYIIYKNLANLHRGKDRKLLLELAEDEKRHYEFFKDYSKTEVHPDWFMVRKVWFLTKIFGLTFGLKSMEKWEEDTQREYKRLEEEIPEIKRVISEEKKHELKIKSMDHEGKLIYISFPS